MTTSLVFSGFGAAFGRYRVSNEELAQLVAARRFTGVSVNRMRAEPGFDAYRLKRPELSEEVAAFCFSAESGGFLERYHVYRYPEATRPRPVTVEAAELAARAVDEALQQAGLSGADVDAWLVSSSSVPGTPGVASLVKEYFVKEDKLTRVRSIQAACGALPVAIEMARDLFAAHPQMRHIVVAHTEVLSQWLLNQPDYVRPMLFGDGAGAVVISRQAFEGESPQGLLAAVSTQHPGFMDHLGVNEKGEMFHEPAEVKKLAVSGMVSTAGEVLSQAGIAASAVDWFVPHQTGNGIVLKTARMLKIDLERVPRESQWHYGNTSGATVLIGMWLLSRQHKLLPGQVLLGAAAGAGGDIGAFVYRVPESVAPAAPVPRLAGKRILLTGASGQVGSEVLRELLRQGADVVALRHSTQLSSVPTEEIEVDFLDSDSVAACLSRLCADKAKFDALIHCAGSRPRPAPVLAAPVPELEAAMKLDCLGAASLTQGLAKARLLKGTVIYLGSAAEDFQCASSPGHVLAKKALHGWSASAAAELKRAGVESLYMQLGLVQHEDGSASKMTPAQVETTLEAWGQDQPLSAAAVANQVVRALWATKVVGVHDSIEGNMRVRRVGYAYAHPLADR